MPSSKPPLTNWRIRVFGWRARARMCAQAKLDAAEDWAAGKRHVRLTFAIITLKRALGLRYER